MFFVSFQEFYILCENNKKTVDFKRTLYRPITLDLQQTTVTKFACNQETKLVLNIISLRQMETLILGVRTETDIGMLMMYLYVSRCVARVCCKSARHWSTADP